MLHIVPPIAVLLAKHPAVDNYDLSSVRDLVCGAAPLGGDTQRTIEAKLTATVFQRRYKCFVQTLLEVNEKLDVQLATQPLFIVLFSQTPQHCLRQWLSVNYQDTLHVNF